MLSDKNKLLHKKVRAHWGNLLECETPEDFNREGFGPESCAFCDEYFYRDPECIGCPIYEKTGLCRCNGTPYDDAFVTINDFVDGERETPPKEEIKEMIKFIDSLDDDNG